MRLGEAGVCKVDEDDVFEDEIIRSLNGFGGRALPALERYGFFFTTRGEGAFCRATSVPKVPGPA